MAIRDRGRIDSFIDVLAEAKLVHPYRLLELHQEFADASVQQDEQSFARFLVEQGCLTNFQARHAVEGNLQKLTIGLYRLVDLIGSGSLGPVYRACGVSDRKFYVIKVLPKRDQWNIKLVRSQIQTFATLPAHPGVVPFIDVGTADGFHYLVWPFAEGRNLESMVREYGPVLPGEVARIGRKVADTLNICHRAGLVHGLIKPSNIQIGQKDQIQILDFGIGALLADNPDDDDLVDTISRATTVASMLECAAPESVADASKWTTLGDQYSLGCSLYFAATGRYPFPGANSIDKVIAHQKETPMPITALNPDVPATLVRIIDRLMSKSPLERYRRWQELVDELAKLANRGPSAHPTPVDIQTPRPSRKLVLDRSGEIVPLEPDTITLPRRTGSSVWKSLSLWQSKPEEVQITIFGPATVVRGQTLVLHAYAHESRDEDRLLKLAKHLKNPPRRIAGIILKGQFARGSWIGLRWIVEGGNVAEENQEIEWQSPMILRRVPITIEGSDHGEPIRCQLHIGTDDGAAGELEFELPSS